ncbi:MAG: ABC-type transport auxiliary lipoprotein family protein [Candidatus Acidiferrales bacterium]
MLSRRLQLISLVMLAIAVAGCGAPRPVKYYVIDPNIAPTTTAASSGQVPVALLVGRFAASTLYRDDRLVYGSGPVELGTYEYDRWAEPPVDMVQNLLIADLRNSGQFRSVSRVSTNVRGDYVVRGHLIAMYGVDKPELVARFTLELELFEPATRAIVWTQTYTHDEPVQAKTVSSIVEAMDRNVRAGLTELSGGISQYFLSHPPTQTPAAK